MLRQLLDAVGDGGPAARSAGARRLAAERAAFIEAWLPQLHSDAAPLSPYRIVWELMQVADRTPHRCHP